jgi:replicative DNA helicase
VDRVEAALVNWTDNRLDERFEALEARLEVRFQAIDDRFGRVEERLTGIEGRLDRLTIALLIMFGGLVAALIAG